MPDEYRLQYRMTAGNALTTGRSVYMDRASLGEMTQLYISGPYFAVHSGATAFEVTDFTTVAITNSRGSGSSLDSWQTLWSRLFPEALASELLLPSSSVPTVSDALITS